MNQAIANNFDIVFSIGYLLTDNVSITVDENPDKKFFIIDDIINGKQNVAAIAFKNNESAYLAGVASENTTKTNKVGFIDGEEGLVVNRFKTGFERGVKDESKNLSKSITLDVKYAASLSDPSNIIYHASGATGQGGFQEATNLNEANYKNKVWVIGVDRNQEKDGCYTLENVKKDNFTLTST
ncbi:BMP family ABC transporter substrate-binding protein [Enterococcus faecalis]|nr:BMP family ABC transporter substrate-binding protein [Enterococcus faecalis]